MRHSDITEPKTQDETLLVVINKHNFHVEHVAVWDNNAVAYLANFCEQHEEDVLPVIAALENRVKEFHETEDWAFNLYTHEVLA